jgi:hypothetical protein
MTPAKLVSSLPDSIRVGPYDMRLLPLDASTADAAGVFGYFKRKDQVIALDISHVSCAGLADTLIHEITHAIWWVYGLEDKDEEERTVATLSTGWTQVYRDNPSLLDWLKKALK